MGVILAWLASAFASAIGYSAVRFIAWKVVIYTLMVTVLPVVLINLMYSLIQGAMNLASGAVPGSGVSSVVVQFTGLAAWLAQHLLIVEGVSLLLTALAFRVTLKLIPFVRL